MTMNIGLTFLCLITLQLSIAQKTIDNSKTPEHQQIAGTQFFLIPPSGFSAAATFQGFQQVSSGSSIFVMEIPGPISETMKGFTKERFSAQGITLKEKDAITVNGYEGVLLKTEQSAQGVTFSKSILVFGNQQTTYMLNGSSPKENKTLKSAILESMLSVVRDADLKVDPLSAVSFTIDTENTKLRFAKNMSGSLLYSADGKVPTESEDKTFFMVGLSLLNAQPADKKLAVINRVKQLPYEDVVIDPNKAVELEVDGVSGYEAVAEGTHPKTGAKELIYLVMLFSDNGYYILMGTAKTDFEKNLDLFKKLVLTFKRK
jgi:hypothetical protein